MNIYSNSFFQRVPDFKIICSILKDGFKAYYCKEEIYTGNELPIFIGIPMVSFCDIPLAHIARNNYGKCGIAMSRVWGREHHLEPVLYYPNDIRCQSTKMIIKASNNFINNRKDADAYRILGYAKPIRKPTKEKGKNSDNYAEREWRKVYANPAPLRWLTEEEYNEYRGDMNEPKESRGTPLKFKVEDIDFLLVDKDHVKLLCGFVMKELSTICGSEQGINDEQRYLLLSKILVYEDLEHNL